MTRGRFFGIALASLGTFLPRYGMAQEAKEETPKATPEKGISFKFQGGSLETYVKALKALCEVNVVMDEGVEGALMPPFELKGVSVESAFQLVQMVAKSNDQGTVGFEKLGGKPTPIYLLRPRTRAKPDAPPHTIDVFSLSELTEGAEGALKVKSETVLTAIREALDEATGRGQSPASVKFHADSGLLFIKGTSDQTDMVRQVLERLRESQAVRRSSVQSEEYNKLADQLRSVQAENQMLRLKEAEVKAEYDRLRRQLDDLKRVSPREETKP